MDVRWLFLDMNAYFASVEQQEHPELRGKPVGVVPMLTDSTCCIAASYEARKYGVRTGTNVGDARRLCPGIHLVEAKHGPYRDYHKRILDVVDTIIPITKVLSVDEFVCRLWDNEGALDDAVALAKRIKHAIKTDVGEYLHCSVGLGFNPFIAKVATELEKPNGLVVLRPNDLPGRLRELPLIGLPGINRGMQSRFHAAGVGSIEQMYALSEFEMRRIWGGVVGSRWWHMLRDDTVTEISSVRGSVSHSHVLPPELRTPDGAWSVVGRLLEKAAERMRRLGYGACHLTAFARNSDHRKWKRDVRMTCADDTPALLLALKEIWEHPFEAPMQVGVALGGLVPQSSMTRSLFDDSIRGVRVTKTVDNINEKYGRGTVMMASLLAARKTTAEDKIAFAKIGEFG